MPRQFVQVAVENTAFSFDRLFSYEVSEAHQGLIIPGMRVLVPFGSGDRERVAMVFSLGPEESSVVKSIVSVLDKEPVLSAEMLSLALWMQKRYYCTIYEAVRLMIPTGLHFRMRNSYVLESGFKNFDREEYPEVQWSVIMLLHRAGRAVPFEKLGKELGITEDCPDFKHLLEAGIICRVSTATGRVKDATAKMVRLLPDFSGKLTSRQQEVYQVLQAVGEASERELCYFTGVSSSVIRSLETKGVLESFEYEVYRRPAVGGASSEDWEPPVLSSQQQTVLDRLIEEYPAGGCGLLYGVTGSGKTSVFLKFIEYVQSLGKGIIVMVPEIALTAQTIILFQKMFGDKIAVFHSGLSLGERLDEWKRVSRNEASIVIGTRSAVFAPVRNLGLIVIDEEQEHTYRSESSPRYDAREVAKFRCHSSSAFCLLCSATPSLDSYRMALEGKYRFHQLTARFGAAQLPVVELIDMNEEGMEGSEQEISPTLLAALRENFQAKKQSILLLNRRGYHTFASCRSCHEVVTCPNCSISLTYHSANHRLMCHYCGYSIPHSKKCPSCGNDAVVFRGAGTQRAEEQLEQMIPEARILRVDTDSMSAKYSLERKLEQFAAGEYDIMIGTQMVAKGLDFENVTLVGVLSADQSLYNDDFRSNERTFDLLTQVVGRSGRGSFSGRALIQTAIPENPVLELAAQQDYKGFYEKEILYRQMLLYPPFVDLLVIGFVGTREAVVRKGANFFLSALRHLAEEEYPKLPLRVLPPSPAAVKRISGKYRYKMIIKCRNSPVFREMISRLLRDFVKQSEFREVTAYADPNPYTIM